jgi:hypothetical protein
MELTYLIDVQRGYLEDMAVELRRGHPLAPPGGGPWTPAAMLTVMALLRDTLARHALDTDYRNAGVPKDLAARLKAGRRQAAAAALEDEQLSLMAWDLVDYAAEYVSERMVTYLDGDLAETTLMLREEY